MTNRKHRWMRIACMTLLATAMAGTVWNEAWADQAIAPAVAAKAGGWEQMWSREDAAHLLRRAGFSGTPEQIDRLHALGMQAAVDYLISGKMPAGAPVDATPFPGVKMEPLHFDEPTTQPDDKAKGKQRFQEINELRMQWVDRMVHTDRPLEEKMMIFWHGLFTSGLVEVKSPDQLLEQDQLLRQNVLGNYRTLTEAIVRDPAMLKYLNNNENVKGKPNENLARELCELFTMGEGNGYTEKDIAEIARALTGAGVRGKAKSPDGEYAFYPGKHDDGPKTIFGHTGNYKPDDVVGLIFDRPEPADYMAKRLWLFFVDPEPTKEELAPIAAVLREKNYEIAPALRAIFTSPAFYTEKAKFSLIKSPVELVVGTIRTSDLTMDRPMEKRAAAMAIQTMGQVFFQPPNVRGWPGGENWITAATMFERYNTATELVEGKLRPVRVNPNGKNPPKPEQANRKDGPGIDPVSCKMLFPMMPETVTADQVVAAAVDRFLQRPLHPEKLKVLVDELGNEPLKLGEEKSEARIRQMIGLLLSTPEYQVE